MRTVVYENKVLTDRSVVLSEQEEVGDTGEGEAVKSAEDPDHVLTCSGVVHIGSLTACTQATPCCTQARHELG